MEQKQEKLMEQYHRRFAALEEYRNKVWGILCTEFFSRYIPRDAKILELGSGWGEFINNIEAAEKYAMDLNPATAERLSTDVTCIRQDCSQHWDLESDSFDIIFTSNFLEHLQDKESIERTISEAERCLKEDGLIICMSPNIKYVHGAYWDFWDHLIPLTEMSCAEILTMCGFSVELCIPRFLPYSMSQGRRPNLYLLSLYLRLPFLWPLLGKQFLVIGRKPRSQP